MTFSFKLSNQIEEEEEEGASKTTAYKEEYQRDV
ncbi:hypothetical protein SDJN02_18004, partial [Cucurbita argyrosperma subsp. argyrosperma]